MAFGCAKDAAVKRGISLACPFYNECDSVPLFFKRVIPVLESLALPFEIVCVNDGSKDTTLEELVRARAVDDRIVGCRPISKFRQGSCSYGGDRLCARAMP